MKNWISLLSIALLISFLNVDMSAQVRKKTTKKISRTEAAKEPSTEWKEKVGGDILIGNIGFSNGFYASFKGDLGYKLHERIGVGAGGKLFYTQYSVQGPDPSIFDYGAFLFARGKITNAFYIQAEYDFVNYQEDPAGYSIRRLPATSINYPMIGLGYSSGFGNWKFGLQLMYIADGLAQDYQSSVIEYWVGGSYNF